MKRVIILLFGAWASVIAGAVDSGERGLPAKADFNGDGFFDLAIGVSYEDIGSVVDAGAVNVLHGSAGMLSSAGDQLWDQDTLIGSSPEEDDYLSRDLAAGDFNGDGLIDLAIGAYCEDWGALTNTGLVHVVYGVTGTGLDTVGQQFWHQDVYGVLDVVEAEDYFGQALAAGDFNGDGYDDLAIGVPSEDIGTILDAGAVQVLYGSSSGLTAVGNQLWSQDLCSGTSDANDYFGNLLATGDFDGDGYDDLAISSPGEDLSGIYFDNAGTVTVLYGSSAGLFDPVPQDDVWHQDRDGVLDTAEDNEWFGYSLAVGDFNHDGYDDLAVGVPYEDVGSPAVAYAGAVNILYGTANGITGTGSEFYHQDTAGIGGVCEAFDLFGEALAAGDFDGDAFDDLAIGASFENWNEPDSGIVQVLYGEATGLGTVGVQLFSEDVLSFGTEEEDDFFGSALAAGDFNGDGFNDLAISARGEDVGAVVDAGEVHILPGTPTGLSTANQVWNQDTPGVEGVCEGSDQFGSTLAAIPFNTRIFADGFESGNLGAWTAAVP